ncbi:NACHT domain-containing protein [Sphaerisporangium sp. TRM90804]|uniref:NACHT domain-containing protein n=1 Tax=Sphaerisporangium sp. TRM90804 TaxID=3031113 RepID=UPI002448138C|nr:NACHT domain-containing protein [Sphaerisporangium sp. TRM90804]MDH2427001.1 NACHT domain-containing protein [Sphaerisporangium sp. TRM90804]
MGRRRERAGDWRLPASVLVVGVVATLVVTVMIVKGLDYANQLSGVLGLTALGASLTTWAARSRRHPPGPEQLDRAAALLRSVVHVRWRSEAASRGLVDPGPLRVMWKPTGREISDHHDVIGGSVIGSSDDVPHLAQAFLRLPRRRMAAIGPPASGKSTLALLLTLELARESEPGHPVPVLLSLASWDPLQEGLAAWIARRITIDHPSISGAPDFGPDMGGRLLASGRLLPILDGLDELPAHLAGPALTQINRAIPGDAPLIVTCRAAEYETAVESGDVLTAAFVVEAQPVRPHDAVEYLRRSIPPGRASRRWKPVFTALDRQTHQPLTQALFSPLCVSLARSVYLAQGDPAELLTLPDQESIERHLIAALVPSVLAAADPPLRYSDSQVLRWLRFLARAGGSDFAWWRLHRTLRAQTLAASVVVAVLAVAAAVAMAAVATTATGIAGLATGVTVAFVFSLQAVMRNLRAENPLVSPAFQLAGRVGALGRHLVRGGWEGLLAGTMGGAAAVYLIRVVAGLDVGPTRILAGGIAGGLLAGLTRGVVSWSLRPVSVAGDTGPAETLRAARNRGLVIGAGLGVVTGGLCALVIGLFLELALQVDGAARLGVLLGASFGVIIGAGTLLTGPWFPYMLAHTVLAARGRLPWRLMTFLDDLYELGVLRRIGPVYQFRHQRIQEFLRGDVNGSGGAGRAAAPAASAP